MLLLLCPTMPALAKNIRQAALPSMGHQCRSVYVWTMCPRVLLVYSHLCIFSFFSHRFGFCIKKEPCHSGLLAGPNGEVKAVVCHDYLFFTDCLNKYVCHSGLFCLSRLFCLCRFGPVVLLCLHKLFELIFSFLHRFLYPDLATGEVSWLQAAIPANL
jgi:hypothetical protein